MGCVVFLGFVLMILCPPIGMALLVMAVLYGFIRHVL